MPKPRGLAGEGPKGPRWQFKARFRAGAYGWKSQPAITRVRQAVTEITKVARKDVAAAGEGAVEFLERVAPAIEGVDGSSGSLGMAVDRAIVALSPIIGAAPADEKTRAAWLERLWDALVADHCAWIERLEWHWGEVCGSKEVASEWADRLLPGTRPSFDRKLGEFRRYVGDSACLSALHTSGRYEE